MWGGGVAVQWRWEARPATKEGGQWGELVFLAVVAAGRLRVAFSLFLEVENGDGRMNEMM